MHDFYINPARIDVLATHILRHFQAGGDVEKQESMASRMRELAEKPFDFEVKNGTAVIPVRGALVTAQIPYWHRYGDITYESITATVEKAAGDPSVKNILLSIFSPGGTVAGCSEAGARLAAISSAESKPLIAHCQQADSAAYWLASAASKIVVDPAGEVGSIGTIMMHMDISKFLEKMGVDITLIYGGKHKGDGWPFDPLSEQAKERYQEDIDFLRGMFVDTVAEYRGLDRDAVAKTEARTYKGQRAIDIGLADEKAYFGDTMKALSQGKANVFYQNSRKKETTMKLTVDSVKAEAPDVANALIEQGKATGKTEGFEAGKKEGFESGKKEGHEAAREEGAKAERARIMGIEEIARPGFEKVVSEAKADGKSTAADVALAMAKVEKSRGAEHLATLQSEADKMPKIEPSGSNQPSKKPDEDPSLSTEDRAKARWEKMTDEEKSEYGSNFKTYLGSVKAEEKGAGRIKNGK